MQNFKQFLQEKKYRTITKKDVDNIGGLWYTKEPAITIYKYPSNQDEIFDSLRNQFKFIRIGISTEGEVFFWNGEIMHDEIEKVLNLKFIIKLEWSNFVSYFIVSPNSYKFQENPIEYIQEYKEGFKNLGETFPDVDVIRFRGKIISFREYI